MERYHEVLKNWAAGMALLLLSGLLLLAALLLLRDGRDASAVGFSLTAGLACMAAGNKYMNDMTEAAEAA